MIEPIALRKWSFPPLLLYLSIVSGLIAYTNGGDAAGFVILKCIVQQYSPNKFVPGPRDPGATSCNGVCLFGRMVQGLMVDQI